jgi:1-pyrroline-5-carboxylate dehydrogenase
MSFGTFSFPMPPNEPVLSYAPNSAEKKRLKEVYWQQRNENGKKSSDASAA